MESCYENSANTFIFAVSRLTEEQKQDLFNELMKKDLCNEEQITALKTACAIIDMYRKPEKKNALMRIVLEALTSKN